MNQEEQYRNREIDGKFDDVHAKLDKILIQSTEHNHRMTKMEAWKSFMQGGLAIVTILLIPVLLLLIQIKFSK